MTALPWPGLSPPYTKGVGWHEAYAQEYFGTYVYGDKNIDLSKIDPEKAFADAHAKASKFVDAVDRDLSRQRASGKKILQFHGWSDVGIPVNASIDYYTGVEKTLGGDVSDFYRLFLAPGVGHCGGGPGPNYFGQLADSTTPFDPSRHALAALVEWVEKGRPPESITATKYENDDPKGQTVRQLPVCRYPQTVRYSGNGASQDASSYVCN